MGLLCREWQGDTVARVLARKETKEGRIYSALMAGSCEPRKE